MNITSNLDGNQVARGFSPQRVLSRWSPEQLSFLTFIQNPSMHMNPQGLYYLRETKYRPPYESEEAYLPSGIY